MEKTVATRKPKAETPPISDTTEVVVVAPKPKIGRPSDYTEDLATLICTRIAEGESLREIVKTGDMPDRVTIYRWLLAHDDFRNLYTRAREDQADTYADEIIAIADEMPEVIAVTDKHGALIEHKLDGAYLQWQKNRIDARKWTAMKLKPKKYGERMQIAGSKEEPMDHKVPVVDLFDGLMKNLELTKQAAL
jgi:DNA primase